MALETVPKDLRHLRACLLCSLVKTIDQFEYDGCDNCESYLQMKGNREMVYECTSSSFDGQLQARGLCCDSHRTATSRCCARAEEQRGDLQIQRHSSEDIRLIAASLHHPIGYIRAAASCSLDSRQTAHKWN
uniref:SPT4 homolog, DSIF elongation factor subunit n=1 Tax=Myripristis murdjan TaxID=586833 RepID=A0A668A8W8_9TELE